MGNMNMIPTNTSLNTVTKRTNMITSTTTTSTAMRMMITSLTMATRRTRTITITVTKRTLMAVTMVTRRIRTATITVTRRIPTVMITMVINNPMEDTVQSNLMVDKATVMVTATNNTEAMGVNLTDMVTNLPMVTDTNLTDM